MLRLLSLLVLSLFAWSSALKLAPVRGFLDARGKSEVHQSTSGSIEDCTTILASFDRAPTIFATWLVQEKSYRDQAHLRAISAMRNRPDDAHLQAVCSGALSRIVQWNANMAARVGAAGGEVGPIELITLALKNHPDDPEVRGLMSNIGSFCDFDVENRKRVVRAGAFEIIHKLMAKHHDAPTELAYQCFASTQVGPNNNTHKLLDGGYVEHSVQAMKDFPHYPGIRGEAVFVLNMLTDAVQHDIGDGSHLQYLQKMADAGMANETIRAIYDAPHEDLDVLRTTTRVFKSGMELLSKFARLGPSTRQSLLSANAIDAIHFAMVSQGSTRIEMPFGGESWGIVQPACDALAALAPDDKSAEEVRGRSVDVINKITDLLTDWDELKLCSATALLVHGNMSLVQPHVHPVSLSHFLFQKLRSLLESSQSLGWSVERDLFNYIS
eukprot:gnl/TRDRNA2_/TRDRNA2_190104_c0_seq1.p1 gnl/TRDRNA2_/TRDRNA2_190104_c0~~gnl/TRDRNA2_/TRDRNA2_190104_c0_seq1.p1  ORF type:complete len:440 (+),score=39.99 gnl/TRDRNA2_/TRDRNA2_190104_c0_seq1:74-1393(+)